MRNSNMLKIHAYNEKAKALPKKVPWNEEITLTKKNNKKKEKGKVMLRLLRASRL